MSSGGGGGGGGLLSASSTSSSSAGHARVSPLASPVLERSRVLAEQALQRASQVATEVAELRERNRVLEAELAALRSRAQEGTSGVEERLAAVRSELLALRAVAAEVGEHARAASTEHALLTRHAHTLAHSDDDALRALVNDVLVDARRVQQENAALRGELERAASRAHELQSKADGAAARHVHSADEVAALQRRVAEYEAQLARAHMQVDAERNGMLQSVRANDSLHTQNAASLQQQLDATREELMALRETQVTLSTQRRALEVDNARLTHAVSGLQDELVKARTRSTAAAAADANANETELAQLRVSIVQVEQRAAASTRECEALQAQNAALREQLTKWEELRGAIEIDQSRALRANEQRELAMTVLHNKEVQQLQQRVARAEDDAAVARAALAEKEAILEAARGRLSDDRAEHDAVQSRIVLLNSELTQCQSDLRAVRSQREQDAKRVAQLQTLLDDARAAAAADREARGTAEAELNSSRAATDKRHAELQKRVVVLEAELNLSRQSLEQAHDLLRLRQQIQDSTAIENADLAAKLASLTSGERLLPIQLELQRIGDQRRQFELATVELQQRVTTLTHELGVARELASSSVARAEQLQRETLDKEISMHRELTELRARLSDSERALADAEMRAHTQQLTAVRWQGETQAADAKATEMSRANDALRAELAQVNDRLLRFQSHANDAVSGASSAHASHIRELLSVEKQLSESQGECQALRQRVVELEAQLRTALTELELTSRRADVRAEALVSDKASLAERLSATEAASLLQRSDAQASSAQLGAALEHARARETVLESQAAALRIRVDELEARDRDFSAQVGRFGLETDALRNQARMVEVQNNELRHALGIANDKCRALEEEAVRLRASAAQDGISMVGERAALQHELDESRRRCSVLADQMREVEQRTARVVADLQAQLEARTAELAALTRQLVQRDAELASARATQSAYTNDALLLPMQQDLQNMQSNWEHEMGQRMAVQAELDRHRKSSNEELFALQSRLLEAEARVAEAESRVAEARAATDSSADRAAHVNVEVAQLRHALESAQAQLARLRTANGSGATTPRGGTSGGGGGGGAGDASLLRERIRQLEQDNENLKAVSQSQRVRIGVLEHKCAALDEYAGRLRAVVPDARVV